MMRKAHAFTVLLAAACAPDPTPLGGVGDFGSSAGPPMTETPEPGEEPRPDVGSSTPEPTPTDEPTPTPGPDPTAEPTPMDPDPPGPDPVTPDPGCDDMVYSLFLACSGLQHREHPPSLDFGACTPLADSPCEHQECSARVWDAYHDQRVVNISVCVARYPACETIADLDYTQCMGDCYAAQAVCARVGTAECVPCSDALATCVASC